MSITGHSISQWLPCPVPSWVPNTIGTWGGNSVKRIHSHIDTVYISLDNLIGIDYSNNRHPTFGSFSFSLRSTLLILLTSNTIQYKTKQNETIQCSNVSAMLPICPPVTRRTILPQTPFQCNVQINLSSIFEHMLYLVDYLLLRTNRHTFGTIWVRYMCNIADTYILAIVGLLPLEFDIKLRLPDKRSNMVIMN